MSEIENAIAEIKNSGLYGNQVHQETLELALEALQEKQEREKGCEWCINDLVENMSDFSELFGCDPNICPMCGRKLGEK